MKRKPMLAMTLSALLLLSVSASADARHRDRDDDRRDHRQHDRYEKRNQHDNGVKRGLPFTWHSAGYAHRTDHHMEEIHDYEWHHRFPGQRAYRWAGHEGFWHHGRYITDAVLFYDHNDRLTSFGYMHDGVFIRVSQGNDGHEDRDSFFFAWFNR